METIPWPIPRSEITENSRGRGLPNELLELIISYLADDLVSLRRTALVCKDFAALSRFYLFREINLIAYFNAWDSLLHKFLILLRDPQSTLVAKLVQKLRFSPDTEDENTLTILRNLPSLAELKISHPMPKHLETIEISLGAQLTVLHLLHVDCRSQKDFDTFQRMLGSLTALQFLALYSSRMLSGVEYESNQALILPRSLKGVSFTECDERLMCAIVNALHEGRHPPTLRTLFLDTESCRGLWQALPANVQVVLDVGFDFLGPVVPGIGARMGPPQIMLICDHLPAAFRLLSTHFIPNLSDSIRKICIDINSSCHPTTKLDQETWKELDFALMKRHEVGFLDHICFRCTMRTERFAYSPSFYGFIGGTSDRTILDRIEELLPRSKAACFLEVDHTTEYFVPTM